MNHRMSWMLVKSVGLALCATLFLSVPVMADDAKAVTTLKLDPEKLAGVNLPAGPPFVLPEDILEGDHQPRGEVLYYGEQLIMEVYEDGPATFRFDPFIFDEFVLVLNGKLILTGTDGVSQEYIAGDSFVVPKGFAGTWKMLGNYRELVVIERAAYEEAYGAPED